MFDKLKDWTKVLGTCQKEIATLSNTERPTSTSKMVRIAKSAHQDMHLTGAFAILSNFNMAAGHIMYLCQREYSKGELPDFDSKINAGTLLEYVVVFCPLGLKSYICIQRADFR